MGKKQHRISRRGTVKAPTLRELLDDPATQLLMQRDGVRRAHLVNLLGAARHRLAAGDSTAPLPKRISHISRSPGAPH